MWIEWINPKTQRRERIYNYFDLESPEGESAIITTRACLSIRFGIPADMIPGFRIEQAEWIQAGPERQKTAA
jgi:hypothetical protein